MTMTAKQLNTLDTGQHETYSQIVKSSLLVGGSSVIGILIRIVRTKAMAYLLGPVGFGLFGIFSSIETLTESIAGIGVNSSGVRQIAEAVGTGDSNRIARTAIVLRQTSVALGALGALLLCAISGPVSTLTFGNARQAPAICLLSLAVLLTLTAAGQTALIQGMRRIADLSKMNLLGAVFGTVVGIPVVYFFRARGVVPSLVIVAGMTIFTSWWYSRKISIPRVRVAPAEIVQEATSLLSLGSIFMIGALLLTAVAYLVRILVLRKAGLEAAGLYQSAWALGGLYVGVIIQAMGADFYPRLTAAARNNALCNRLVNEQATVGLLLAGPGVMATITFAPLALLLFYSNRFGAAVGVLRWVCLGTLLQVVSWPMGFVLVAKNRRVVYFWCEIVCALVYALLAWFCVGAFGLNGGGIAFFGYCLFHGLLHYPIVARISGFRWSAYNLRTGALFAGLICMVCLGFHSLPRLHSNILGVLGTLIAGAYSTRALLVLVPTERIPRPIRRLLGVFGGTVGAKEQPDAGFSSDQR